MRLFRCLSSPVGVGATFFVLAALTVSFSRFSGGLAMVWVSNALLAGRLVVTPEKRWGPWLATCAIASAVATGFFGLGWAAAVPMAFVNVLEAAAAGLLMRRISIAFWPDDTLEWLAAYYIGIGLIIPLASGGLAALVAALTNNADPIENFTHWIIGHSLGLMACLPVFRFVYWRASRGRSFLPSAQSWQSAILVLGTFALLTGVVFSLEVHALLIFPLLFLVVGAAVLEEALIAAMPVVLIAIGGTMTALELGPIAQMDFAFGDRLQFFQLYVGIAVLAGLPVSCERSRRLAEIQRMSERLDRLEGLEPSRF